MSTALRLAQEAKSIFEQADPASRALTPDEREYVQDLLDRAEQVGRYEKRFAKAVGLTAEQAAFLGRSFTDSEASDPGSRFTRPRSSRRSAIRAVAASNFQPG